MFVKTYTEQGEERGVQRVNAFDRVQELIKNNTK